MWTYVFHRTKALINIAFHRYMFPSFSRCQLSIRDIEILVEFEKVAVQGKFELATDELLERSFSVLRSLYSQFQQREIFLNDIKESKLLVEAVTGEKLQYVDGKILDERLTDENFKRGFDGLEAEFRILSIEIEKFKESPPLYDRIYRQAKKFYFALHRDKLDPDRKITKALSPVDEVELDRENIICFTHIGTHPSNNKHLSDFCLHAILNCKDVEMIEDFVATKKRGRRPNDSLYEHVKNQLNVWAKCGMIKKVPTKNSLYKVLQKLRTNSYVKSHLLRLKNST